MARILRMPTRRTRSDGFPTEPGATRTNAPRLRRIDSARSATSTSRSIGVRRSQTAGLAAPRSHGRGNSGVAIAFFVSTTQIGEKMKTGTVTRTLVLVALMLNLGVAGALRTGAEERLNVKMTFSGTMLATTINLQAGTVTDDVNLAGDGSLGPFTFHELHADSLTTPQQPPAHCSAPLLFLPVETGGGVLRFQDGSLLVVELVVELPEGPEDGICIDFAAGKARLTETYKITGGTKRLKGASGTLTLTATVIPVVFNASGWPQLLTSTGKFEGTISGVGHREEGRDDRQ